MIRNMLWSTGRLQTWRWPDHYGHGYYGPAVQYSEEYIEITPAEKIKLQKCEDRRYDMDKKIRRNRG